MTKITQNAPLFAGPDLLVNGIMRQPLIRYSPGENPLTRIPRSDIMTVMVTKPQGFTAIGYDYPLPPRDFVGIEIPGSAPPIKALSTANVMPQVLLEHELHDHLKLNPGKDYTLIGVQDPRNTRAFTHGEASRFLLVVKKDAYKKMAVEALHELADPHMGALLTQPERLKGAHETLVSAPFTALLASSYIPAGPAIKKYEQEMKNPDSAVSKLIDQIMQKAEIPNLDARKIIDEAAGRENFEMASRVNTILRAKSPSFTTHVLSKRASDNERTPPQ